MSAGAVVPLSAASPSTGGGKAATLGALARAGFPVPAGFVVTADAHRAASTALGREGSVSDGAVLRERALRAELPADLVESISAALARLSDGAPDGWVAVRSSATTEDGPTASSAGQHESVLAVRGVDQVCRAVLACWASLWTERAVAYRARTRTGPEVGGTAMAVLVQRFVDADVSGVVFTGAGRTGGTSVVEASWGLGAPIVGGRVTPDLWRVTDDVVVEHRTGSKRTRTDRSATALVTRPVPVERRGAPCLPDPTVLELHALGGDVAAALHGAADVEWAIARGRTHVLQARPVTAALPDRIVRGRTAVRAPTAAGTVIATGVPASSGTATGPVRVVSGPGDFARVAPGDVIVCRDTDPAWTPLFSIASAVVTETGGVLSHAAIVAREVGIPAVLAVPRATTALAGSIAVTVDGDAGLVTTAPTGARS